MEHTQIFKWSAKGVRVITKREWLENHGYYKSKNEDGTENNNVYKHWVEKADFGVNKVIDIENNKYFLEFWDEIWGYKFNESEKERLDKLFNELKK